MILPEAHLAMEVVHIDADIRFEFSFQYHPFGLDSRRTLGDPHARCTCSRRWCHCCGTRSWLFCRVPERRHVQPWLCLTPLTPPPLSHPALFLFRSSGNVPQFCKLPPLFVLLRISLLQRKALPSGALARFIPNSFFYDTASLSFVRGILTIPKLRFKSEAEGLYVRYS